MNMKSEFKKKELATAIREKASTNPRQGSVVKALDNNIGILSPHVILETSHSDIRLSRTKVIQP
tara:strand:+ start:416 stop:607 length:192 start_codon:yes stop_codon:yes gene_type:complete